MKETIEKYIHAYNSFDIATMLTCFSANCIFSNISNSGDHMHCMGKVELGKLAEQSKGVFSSREQKITNWILMDNKAAIEIDYFAKVAIDLPNGLKAGQELNLKGVSFFEFEGSLISHLRDYS